MALQCNWHNHSVILRVHLRVRVVEDEHRDVGRHGKSRWPRGRKMNIATLGNMENPDGPAVG